MLLQTVNKLQPRNVGVYTFAEHTHLSLIFKTEMENVIVTQTVGDGLDHSISALENMAFHGLRPKKLA